MSSIENPLIQPQPLFDNDGDDNDENYGAFVTILMIENADVYFHGLYFCSMTLIQHLTPWCLRYRATLNPFTCLKHDDDDNDNDNDDDHHHHHLDDDHHHLDNDDDDDYDEYLTSSCM